MHSPSKNTPSAQTSWTIIAVIIIAVIGVSSWVLSTAPEAPITKMPAPIIKPAVSEAPSIKEKHTDIASTHFTDSQQPPKSEIKAQEPEPNGSKTLSFENMKGEGEPSEESPLPIEQQSENNLPHLNNSDSWLIAQLIEYVPEKALHSLVVKKDIARKFVVFIDNFAQGMVAYQHSPLVKLKQPFAVKSIASNTSVTAVEEKNTEAQYLSLTSNLERFSPHIELFLAIDTQTLVNWYQQLLPLFNQAYQELGYEEQAFTQTVHLAIGRIVTFDMPKNVSKLTQPHVMYKYSDKTIEALPDAEKLLIRLGDENMSKLQKKLEEISSLLY